MTDSTQVPAADSATDSTKRKNVSERGFITGGAPADKIEEATGATYTLLGEGGKVFTYEFGKNPKADTMFAIFGYHTKVGNMASTVLNNKANPGTVGDAADAIDDFLAGVDSPDEPTWAERAGGVGVKIDKDALAAAYVEFAANPGDGVAGQVKDLAVVRKALDDKPVLIRQLRALPKVAKLYADKVGKPIKSTEEALGLI